MTDLTLDRMEIEEAGANPARLAAAIHAQLGEQKGPVPVHAIARALDIIEIREEALRSLEGALLTVPERGRAASCSTPARAAGAAASPSVMSWAIS